MKTRPLLLADSSSLIGLDRKTALATLDAYRVVIPPAVKRELVDDALKTSPTAPVYRSILASAHRFQYRIERRQIAVLKPDYKRYGKVIQGAQKRIAKFQRVKPHQVPKADAEMVGAVAQLRAGKESLRVLCDDEPVRKSIAEKWPDVILLRAADLL